jgi:uncharacterized protein (DUF1684 family)
MKIKTILILLLAFAAIAVIVYSFQNKPSSEDYGKEIQNERDEKDAFMRSDKNSPLRGPEGEFKPLRYFPADLKYQINATLIPIENKKRLSLSTSNGEENEYREFAFAKFVLDGVENNLLILEITEPGPYRGTLFLAFADETSAKETYGAGRYLDLKKVPGATSILLDFNKAYNPYCAYSNDYSCPFPPPQNVMKVAIRAGEKSYH